MWGECNWEQPAFWASGLQRILRGVFSRAGFIVWKPEVPLSAVYLVRFVFADGQKQQRGFIVFPLLKWKEKKLLSSLEVYSKN